ASAACEVSGSAWLLPAASTTLQRVEGNKSLRVSPFPTRVFTLPVCTKAAEEKQATEKSKISCSTRCGIRLIRKTQLPKRKEEDDFTNEPQEQNGQPCAADDRDDLDVTPEYPYAWQLRRHDRWRPEFQQNAFTPATAYHHNIRWSGCGYGPGPRHDRVCHQSGGDDLGALRRRE